jgi:hypothetical protein
VGSEDIDVWLLAATLGNNRFAGSPPSALRRRGFHGRQGPTPSAVVVPRTLYPLRATTHPHLSRHTDLVWLRQGHLIVALSRIRSILLAHAADGNARRTQVQEPRLEGEAGPPYLISGGVTSRNAGFLSANQRNKFALAGLSRLRHLPVTRRPLVAISSGHARC